MRQEAVAQENLLGEVSKSGRGGRVQEISPQGVRKRKARMLGAPHFEDTEFETPFRCGVCGETYDQEAAANAEWVVHFELRILGSRQAHELSYGGDPKLC